MPPSKESSNAATMNDRDKTVSDPCISGRGSDANQPATQVTNGCTDGVRTNSCSRVSGSRVSGAADLVDQIVDLNTAFASSLLEVSKSYLASIQHLQNHMLQARLNLSSPRQGQAPDLASQELTDQIIQLSETARLQLAWASRVSDKYMAEADRLVHMAQQTSHNSWSPILSKRGAADSSAPLTAAE